MDANISFYSFNLAFRNINDEVNPSIAVFEVSVFIFAAQMVVVGAAIDIRGST